MADNNKIKISEGMSLEAKVDLLLEAVVEMASLITEIHTGAEAVNELLSEVIEKIDNLNTPGSDYDIDYDN